MLLKILLITGRNFLHLNAYKKTQNTKGFNLVFFLVIFVSFVVNFIWFTAEEMMIK